MIVLLIILGLIVCYLFFLGAVAILATVFAVPMGIILGFRKAWKERKKRG